MLEIIDGIGRGKMYTIDGPIFRIGSAVSDRPEEKNDLILSDAGAFISRYHCAIVRKDGQFFLIDSSLNGTYMDEAASGAWRAPGPRGWRRSSHWPGWREFKFLMM